MSGALWVPLSVNFWTDPKILACGFEAQILYIRGLCQSKQVLSDGFIACLQAKLLCFDMEDEGDVAVRSLLAQKLWSEVPGGYQIEAWQAHNQSAEEVQNLRESRVEAGRKGGLASARSRAQASASSKSKQRREEKSREDTEKRKVEKEPSRGTSIERSDPEPRRLAELLASLVAKNGAKTPTSLDGWTEDLEKLIRIDGRDPGQVELVIRWCQADPFWSSNILSGAKLRQKYDQLNLKRSATSNGRAHNNRDSLTSAAETFLGVR